MTLSITETLIASDITHHTAQAGQRPGWWKCSWMGEFPLTKDDALVAMELAEIVAKGRDGGPDTTNYAYNTWRRVMELSEVLGVLPLKTVLYLEGLSQGGSEETDRAPQ